MSVVEAASSLFDSPDTTSDPFSAVVAADHEPASSTVGPLIADNGHETSILFQSSGADAEANALFSEPSATLQTGNTVEVRNTWPSEPSPYPSEYAEPYSTGASIEGHSDYYTASYHEQDNYQTQGWHDEYGQWHAHEQSGETTMGLELSSDP